MIEEKYYSLTQLKSITRIEGNQWTDLYEIIHPDDFKKLKPADVRPIVKGEWIKNKDRVGWHCSVCKADNNFAYSWNSETGKVEFQDNYCPCCGADMRGTDG